MAESKRCEDCGGGLDRTGGRGRCRRCYQRYCRKNNIGAWGRHLKMCPVCQESFRTRDAKKIYCTMKCYTRSDQFQKMRLNNVARVARQARTRHGLDPDQQPTVACGNCGQPVKVQPGRRHNKRFCSQACYRKYMADRFDRWVANPETIALPQCYDEFLTREELPCLVEGCDWYGKNLSAHMNFTHGVQAKDFKKMAGFNLSTGVVSIDTHQQMVDRNARFGGFMGHDLKALPKNQFSTGHHRNKDCYRSLESKEHANKSRSEVNAQYQAGLAPKKYGPCRHCGKSVEQPPQGRRLYCDLACRNNHYKEKVALRNKPLVCGHCGATFMGNRNQYRRSQRGQFVACGITCKQSYVGSHPKPGNRKGLDHGKK